LSNILVQYFFHSFGTGWGPAIADCQLPIFDWRWWIKPIGNRKSKIENATHPYQRLYENVDTTGLQPVVLEL
jgi:hypothetical protein